MKLPYSLVIQDQKITRYLLVYQPQDDKSQYLANYGYTLDNWEILKSDLLKSAQESDIAESSVTNWGIRYTVKCQWITPNNQLLKVTQFGKKMTLKLT